MKASFAHKNRATPTNNQARVNSTTNGGAECSQVRCKPGDKTIQNVDVDVNADVEDVENVVKVEDEVEVDDTTVQVGGVAVEDVRIVDKGDACVRHKKVCITHNCAMVRHVEKKQRWTKLKHGFAYRTRAVVFWKCSLTVNLTKNHETSLKCGSSSNSGAYQANQSEEWLQGGSSRYSTISSELPGSR